MTAREMEEGGGLFFSPPPPSRLLGATRAGREVSSWSQARLRSPYIDESVRNFAGNFCEKIGMLRRPGNHILVRHGPRTP
jgi:hypothetical protein